MPGPLGEFGVGFAAIAEDDETVVASGAFVEGLDGEAERAGQLAAAARHGEGVDGLDGLSDSGVIGGEGSLKVGVASENDEADAVAGEEGKQVLSGELGAGEAIGSEVVSEHRAGGIDCDDEIASSLALRLLFLAPAGAAGSENEEAKGTELEQKGRPGAQR